MKFKTLLFIPISVIGISQINVFAQSRKENTKIIIKSDVNGKTTTKEMSFDKKMSQEEINKILQENTTDSTKVKVLKGDKKVTIIVDDEQFDNQRNSPRNFDEESNDINNIKTYRFRSPKITKDEFKRKSRDFIDEIPYRIQKADDFFIETFSYDDQFSIKGAEVFSNNPRSEFINVKFRVTKKEKVRLTLVDLLGKIVAQDSIEDFTGDFFGQMKVDKNLKGNFILIIAQGETGESVPVSLK